MSEKAKILGLNHADSEPLANLNAYTAWGLILSYFERQTSALEENNKKKYFYSAGKPDLPTKR